MPFHVNCSGQGFPIRCYLFKDQRKQERDITREKVFQAERSETCRSESAKAPEVGACLGMFKVQQGVLGG